MNCQQTTIKITYLTQGSTMTLEEHAKMIRELVAGGLSIKVVRCEAVGQAQWEE